ncbi:MAG: hypothetical protein KF749_11975 [Bacteroidetes bacterium]|nr:hypothetical protein [Bacteroidota bacterium]MCW5894222.1 hypothetical protein [Bacteroidota bacterium]
MNIDDYDSRLGVEDILRDELGKILPARYSVKAGVVNDRSGNTAGDIDIVVFNDIWFPSLKAGATSQSRRVHLPIDGVYAVCEVKQTIDFKVLDEAMKKLVMCHRLQRPMTHAQRLVENREVSHCVHGLSNPLYSAIIATNLKAGIDINEMVDRFFLINKTLKRLEVVRAFCVLGHGTVTWAFKDEKNEIRPALFMMEDLLQPIFPAFHRIPQTESPLYALVSDLMLHLYHSVLAPEDIAPSYGPVSPTISVPMSNKTILAPDNEIPSRMEQ